jgi:DHA2 family multidrug resistance protein
MSAPALTSVPDTQLGRALVLLTVSLCTMLYSLTVTVVNVTLPQLQGALSATPDQVAWVVTLNIVATAVATPVTGWMVARYGQRNVMLWSVVGFTVSSLLCATANSLSPLLAYRVGQGAFGAPMVPLSQAIVVGTYPPEQRAMAQSFFGMAVVVGPAIGPVLGGWLAEEYNWRWVFLLIVPLCIVALLGVLTFIREGGRREGVRLDWTGFITLSVAVTCLQLVMDRGERLDWFQSVEIVSLAALMGLAFYLFVTHTITAREPFISPRLFLDRNFSIGLLLVFVYGMLNFTPIVLFPPMLQNLKGWPDSLIGWMLAMRGAGLVFGFFLAGRMGRLDPRIGLVVGLLLVGYSGVVMTGFDLNATVSTVAWTGVIQGIGCGMMWVPLSVVTFATLRPDRLPEASAIFHPLRNFGSSIFISLSVMTVIRSAKVNYAEIVEHLSPFNEALRYPSVTGMWSTESAMGLAAISKEVGRQSQMIGYTNAFALYTAICFAAVPFLLLVKIRKHR